MHGELMKILAPTEIDLSAGYYTVSLVSQLAKGYYLIELTAGNQTLIEKLVVR